MTRSVRLAGLPRAGENSKPHHYKQKAQKMKVLPKTWVLRGKTFEDFRQEKNRNTILDLPKKPFGTQRPCTSQLNKALVNSKIYPKQNQKKPSDQNCWIFAN